MLAFLFYYREAVVISVQNLSGFVSVDGDGSWVSTGQSSYRTDRRPDPVSPSSVVFLVQ